MKSNNLGEALGLEEDFLFGQLTANKFYNTLKSKNTFFFNSATQSYDLSPSSICFPHGQYIQATEVPTIYVQSFKWLNTLKIVLLGQEIPQWLTDIEFCPVFLRGKQGQKDTQNRESGMQKNDRHSACKLGLS